MRNALITPVMGYGGTLWFLADAEDFSEDKIAAAGINRRFYNDDLERCFAEIREYVLENVCNAQEMNTVSGD